MSKGCTNTDVLYQRRDLDPTCERLLTPISDVHLENFEAGDVKFISRILGDEELPVDNILPKNIEVKSVSGEEYINQNVLNFNHED